MSLIIQYYIYLYLFVLVLLFVFISLMSGYLLQRQYKNVYNLYTALEWDK